MTDEFDDPFDDPVCSCGELRCPTTGDNKYPGLIVWEMPTSTEVSNKRFGGGSYAEMLYAELNKVGISSRKVRQAALITHPDPKDNKCKEFGLELLIRELIKSTVVLAIGPTVSKQLTGNPHIQSAICVPCVYNKNINVVTTPSLGLVFTISVGEVRLAIEKFRRYINE